MKKLRDIVTITAAIIWAGGIIFYGFWLYQINVCGGSMDHYYAKQMLQRYLDDVNRDYEENTTIVDLTNELRDAGVIRPDETAIDLWLRKNYENELPTGYGWHLNSFPMRPR